MGKALNLVGQVFGRLMVLERSEKVRNNYTWKCICECGNYTFVQGSSLMYGSTKSCGCLQKESSQSLIKEEKRREHPLFNIYHGIKKRCYNESCEAYERYGAKGIIMSDEWLQSFDKFVEDVGTRPSPNHSLERIDNKGNYCKENTRWATSAEQARNQGKYKNNTSGVTGVNLMNKDTNPCWLARVSDPITGKDISKSFSCNKFGHDEAFRLACEHRKFLLEMINNQFNAGYSEMHGK